MKMLCRYYLILLVGFLAQAASTPDKNKLDYAFKKLALGIPIRVLLQESAPKDVSWELSSDEGFVLYAPVTKEKTVFKGTKLVVSHKNGSFHFNGQKISGTHIFVLPLRGSG